MGETVRKLVFAAFFILFIPFLLWCQVSTGTINVEVQDSSGAMIPEASVRLTHLGTGQVRTGVAPQGTLRTTFLPLGRYQITVESPGFKTKTISGVDLRVDQDATISVVLLPGEVREIVEVTESTPLLESN